MFGWIRPFKKSSWKLSKEWRKAHKFMSTQALGVGTVIISVLIAVGSSRQTLMIALWLTVLMVLAGSLIDQPEVDEDA